MSIRRVTAREVVCQVQGHMTTGEGYSVIRLGDGECRLMGWPDKTSRRELYQSLKYWFGRTDFDREDLDAMANLLRQAIASADVVGVPGKEQLADGRPGWANVERYLDEYKLLDEDMWLCDNELHIQMAEEGLYEELLLGLPDVSVVTCRDVGFLMESFFRIEAVTVYKVPVEAQTAGWKATNHWPDRFDQLYKEIEVTYPGQLFLVGAGPLGKIYCQWVKERGGVALDVGSVVDAWVSIDSRTWIREGSYSLC